MFLMMKYLEGKLQSLLLRKCYLNSRDTVRDLLSKLMTSDLQLQESFNEKFKNFIQHVSYWEFNK